MFRDQGKKTEAPTTAPAMAETVEGQLLTTELESAQPLTMSVPGMEDTPATEQVAPQEDPFAESEEEAEE